MTAGVGTKVSTGATSTSTHSQGPEKLPSTTSLGSAASPRLVQESTQNQAEEEKVPQEDLLDDSLNGITFKSFEI